MEMHTNTQFTTRKQGCRCRTEQAKQVPSLSAVTWSLQPTQTPFLSPAGGHPNICRVHFVSLAGGGGVLALGSCFPGKAGACRSPSRLHQPQLLIRLGFQSCWFLQQLIPLLVPISCFTVGSKAFFKSLERTLCPASTTILGKPDADRNRGSNKRRGDKCLCFTNLLNSC